MMTFIGNKVLRLEKTQLARRIYFTAPSLVGFIPTDRV